MSNPAQLKVYFGDAIKGIPLCEGSFSVSTPNCEATDMYEQSSLRQLAGNRLTLYKMSPVVSMWAPLVSLPYYQQEVLRLAVSISNVLIFTTSAVVPGLDDTVLVAFVEFAEGNETILIDCYVTSMRELKSKAEEGNKKKHVVLDLDKTLLLSDADCRVDQKHLFTPDIEIGGKMAVTDDIFSHKMMIRPGAYNFIRDLTADADTEVYVFTAGDLHYARAAVGEANKRHWQTSSVDDSRPFGPLEDVFIPLTHVFSVRNHPKYALKKTFERILPFRQADTQVFAVDDDPNAWEIDCRKLLLEISPFQPTNNSPDHLLKIAESIKNAAKI